MRLIKLFLSALLFLATSNSLLAQKDTLWYNSKWKLSAKEDASFYRPAVKKEGDLYRIQDYYISGTLQMNALSKYPDKDFWNGKVSWYTEEGKLYQEATYKENKIHGEYISYIEDKKVISTYENGIYTGGETNTNCGSYFIYLEETSTGFKRTYHAGDLKGIRYEEFLDKNKIKLSVKYYDTKGVFLGEAKESNNGKKMGIVAYYNYNPFSVSSIQYYSKNGDYLGATNYYKNGNVREEFVQEPEYKTIYYTTTGEVLGSINYTMRNSYLNPNNGAKYFFNTAYYASGSKEKSKEFWITKITTYKNGIIILQEEKYENGTTKSISNYVDNKRELDVFYDESGKEISRLSYKNYNPFHGKQYLVDGEKIFKEGVLDFHLKYYPKTTEKLMVYKDNVETYYDKDGKVLGTLKLDGESYNKPLDGVRYSSYYNGVFERIEEYKDGDLIKVTSTRKGDQDLYFKKIEMYDSSGYNKVKEINFYSNGKMQSSTEFKKYNPISAVYFNEEGEEIGKYDFKTKEGKRYEFFYSTNQIKEIEEVREGELLRNLVYERVYNYEDKAYNYILSKDIDTSKEAIFYDQKGQVFAKASYKDGKPYNGTVYEKRNNILFHVKEGKKNGVYEKYNYKGVVLEKGVYKEDLKDGLFETFNDSEAKLSSIKYIKDVPTGDAIYYDGKGNVLSTTTYKNGKPYKGKVTKYNDYSGTYKEDTYKEGKLIQTVDSRKDEKIFISYIESNIKEVTKFNDNNIKTLTYTLKNEALDGKVIAYDAKGNVERTAEFEAGNFLLGKVKIKGQYNANKDNYLLVIRTETTFAVEKYNGEELEFKAFEKLQKGMRSQHLYKLNSKIDYIYVDDIL